MAPHREGTRGHGSLSVGDLGSGLEVPWGDGGTSGESCKVAYPEGEPKTQGIRALAKNPGSRLDFRGSNPFGQGAFAKGGAWVASLTLCSAGDP